MLAKFRRWITGLFRKQQPSSNPSRLSNEEFLLNEINAAFVRNQNLSGKVHLDLADLAKRAPGPKDQEALRKAAKDLAARKYSMHIPTD